MVKRTNRIHNLNRMILDYKREQEKFEVIQTEICNQQKEIEDLRLLILSTNFMNHDSVVKSRPSDTSKETNCNLSTKSAKELRQTGKPMNKDRTTKSKADRKSNDFKDNVNRPKKGELKSDKSTEITQLDQVGQNVNSIDRRTAKRLDQSDKQTDQPNNGQHKESRQLSKSKGLQTISKNILNQNNNKYFNKLDGKANGKLIENSKKDDLIKNESFDVKAHSTPIKSKSIELLDKLNKLKSTSSKFENQENPNDGLGLNKISKSIKKTKLTAKSALKSTNKLTNSNRALQRL